MSHSNANDKKTNTRSPNSVAVLSNPTNNTSGPSGGTNSVNDHSNVVAALSQHASAAIPVASLALPSIKPQSTNPSSTSSAAKQFFIRRVRSRSKSDQQSLPDKSLFSRFFPKRTKKPLPILLTTSMKAIETHTGMNGTTQRQNVNNDLLTTSNQSTNNYDDDEYDDERIGSTGSLSDNGHQTLKDDRIDGTESSHTTRDSTKANISSGKGTGTGPNSLLPTSDSQYYASMSSAPKGFSISYHKHMTTDNNELRTQDALTRLQQQNKERTAASCGTSQLLVCNLRQIIVHYSLII